MKNTAKALLTILTPLLLLVPAYIFFLMTEPMSASAREVIWWSPFVVFLPAMIVSCRFNKSRVFFVLLMLSFNLLLMYYYFSRDGGTVLYFNSIYPVMTLLIPLNILIFSFLKERGFLTLWGILRFGFIFLQVLFIVWVIARQEKGLIAFATCDLAALDFPLFTPLPQASILAFFLAGAVLTIKHVCRRSFHDVAFIGVLAAMLVVLHTKDLNLLTPIFFAVSGIMLLISVIQHSYSMAFYDELTGLPSRRCLEQDMMKLGLKYAIAMLDIDHFKKCNDTYGHNVGDDILRFFASIIRKVSGGGKAYRYGGEEFAIIFPGKNIQEIIPHLEKIREEVASRKFSLRGKDRPKKKPKKIKGNRRNSRRVSITVSIGAAEKNEIYNDSLSVIKAADAALYRAKKKGRNCVSV